MKTFKKASFLVLLTALLSGATALCPAQVIVTGAGTEYQTLIPLSSVPGSGMFFSATGQFPPTPFCPFVPPFGIGLPVFPIYASGEGTNIFVYDDSNFDYAAFWAANASLGGGGTLSMDEDGPPMMPDGTNSPIGGTNAPGGGGTGFNAQTYTTNDLWLQIVSLTNQTAALVIHPPWNVTNGIYDLLFTTNLAPPASWQWILRTSPGQTNLFVTNATGIAGFYKLGSGPNNSPGPSSAGTDFWVAFPYVDQNLSYGPPQGQLILYLTSHETNFVTVSIEQLDLTTNVSLAAGDATNIDISYDFMLTNSAYDTNLANGIHVTSSQLVSVYAFCFDAQATTAFACYPTPMLGTSYCVMARPTDTGWGCWSQFAILGTETNTTVWITPSATAALVNHGTNRYPETLQPGVLYQICSSNYMDDVTGTVITSDKPVAVFAGDNGAYVPSINNSSGNPLVQEQLPVSAWGTNALALSFGRPGGDSFRVLAASNNTVVWVNGVEVTTLQAGSNYDTILDGPVEIQGSQPIQVAQFSQGGSTDTNWGYGDPCEILLPPAASYLNSYTIAVPDTNEFSFDSFLNLIVPEAAISATLLDGSAVAATNFTSIGSSGYYAARISVTGGTHTVSSFQPIEVEVYGFAYFDAYGFIGGVTSPP